MGYDHRHLATCGDHYVYCRLEWCSLKFLPPPCPENCCNSGQH